jgi:hypothetical protein
VRGIEFEAESTNPAIISSPLGDCVVIYGVGIKFKPIPRCHMSWPGERQAAEKALERNLLADKMRRLFSIQISFSAIRTVGHNLQITAILKLWKLSVFPFPAIVTQSVRGEGMPACW